MNRLFSTRALGTDFGILLLRLIIGGLFVWHGVDALFLNYKLYLSMSKSTIGLGANFEYHLVVISYLVCGIFVVLGFLTRLSIIPIFIAMTVAFLIAHDGQKFYEKELPFVYMLSCIAVFIFGSGCFSVDRLIFKK
jgi:putative oxidoreductase